MKKGEDIIVKKGLFENSRGKFIESIKKTKRYFKQHLANPCRIFLFCNENSGFPLFEETFKKSPVIIEISEDDIEPIKIIDISFNEIIFQI